MYERKGITIKKIESVFLALIMLFSLCSISALADDSTSEDQIVVSADGALESGSFEAITRAEYITTKAEQMGISYSEAEAELDSKIQGALESIAPPENSGGGMSPDSWTGDTTVPNGDGTYTVYGRVSNIYTADTGLQALYYTEAVIISSHYGATWVDCNETGGCQPYGNGIFTFTGDTTAAIISNTQLRLACSGYFEITADKSSSLGINAGLFDTSYTIGTTTFYRDSVYTSHVETLVQST